MLTKKKLGKALAIIFAIMLIFQVITTTYTQMAFATTEDMTFEEMVENLAPGEVAAMKTVFWTDNSKGEAEIVFELQGRAKEETLINRSQSKAPVATDAEIVDTLSMYFQVDIKKLKKYPDYYHGTNLPTQTTEGEKVNIEIGEIGEDRLSFSIPLKLKKEYLPTDGKEGDIVPVSAGAKLNYINQDGKIITLDEGYMGSPTLNTGTDSIPDVPDGGIPPEPGDTLPPDLGGDNGDGGALPPTDSSLDKSENETGGLPQGSVSSALSTIAVAPTVGEIIPIEKVQVPTTNFLESITVDTERNWSILNIAITALIETISIGLLLTYISKKRAERKGQIRDKSIEENIRSGIRIVSFIPAIGSIALILLTQDMGGQVVFVNDWSVVYFALLIVQIAVMFLTREPSSEDNDYTGLM